MVKFVSEGRMEIPRLGKKAAVIKYTIETYNCPECRQAQNVCDCSAGDKIVNLYQTGLWGDQYEEKKNSK
jgi:hypothetical protein